MSFIEILKRRYATLRAILLCDASGTRIGALMSRLFGPEKAVAFTSFSTNFTFFSIKDCDKVSAVKGIYCNSCVSRTLKCDACSRHDVTLRRGEYQKRTTIRSKTSNSTKTSTVVKDFFQATCSKVIHAI